MRRPIAVLVLLAAAASHAWAGDDDVTIFRRARAARWYAAETNAVCSGSALPLSWRADGGNAILCRSSGATDVGPLAIHLLDPLTKREAPLRMAAPLRNGDRLLLQGETADRSLGFELVVDPQPDRIAFSGMVTNRTGSDRPVRVSVEIGLDARGWRWWDALRSSRAIDDRQRYAATTPVPVGWNGQMSRYPFSCISSGEQALSFAVPLRRPRVFEIAYDAPLRAYGIAFDMALSPLPLKTPNQGTFFFDLYAPDPRWGLRGAADAYYRLYPDDFVARADRDGAWMPFTRIDTVADADDFRFAFHEYGSVDLADNNRRGIYSFRYLEPWTYWMKMDPGVPRTDAAAWTQLLAHAEGSDAWNRDMARATISSAIADPDGSFAHQFVHQPWCDGTLFFNNSDPDLPPARPGYTNMGQLNLRTAREELSAVRAVQASHWEAFGAGYAVADTDRTEAAGHALLLARTNAASVLGAVQTVTLAQTEPRPLLVSGWSRADGVTGPDDDDYSLYADVQYTDGSYLWHQAVAFETGTRDWQQRKVIIRPEKPIQWIKVFALLRGSHQGAAWFDDLSLIEFAPGADGPTGSEPERLLNGGIDAVSEPGRVDGIYLDSMEGWAKKANFRRDHFRWVDVPLTYEAGSGKPAILNAFSVFEFTHEMADFLHADGRLLMGNWVLIDFPFYAALLDVPGREVNWQNSDGGFAPDSDEALGYRRVLSYHKPYPLLLNVRFDQFTPQMMEWYFQRCLLYATAPSMFSFDAATHPYFEDPALYNRDRPLFMRYMPVLQRLSRAGWEPITQATSDAPALLVERYGTDAATGLFLVVHNDAREPTAGSITVDRTGLALGEGAWAWDVLNARRLDLDADGSLAISLESYESLVLRLFDDRTAPLLAWARDAADELARTAASQIRMKRMEGDVDAHARAAVETIRGELEGVVDAATAARLARQLDGLAPGAAALAQPDLRWRLEEAQNAVSMLQSAMCGLTMDVDMAAEVVSPSHPICRVTIRNAGEKPIALESLRVIAATNAPQVVPAPKDARPLGAGEERDLRVSLPVPAGFAVGSRWPLEIAIAGTAGGAPFHIARRTTCRVAPATVLWMQPDRASSFGAPASFHVVLRNNGSDMLRVTLDARSDLALAWTQRIINVHGEARRQIALEATPPSVATRRVFPIEVSVTGPGAVSATVTSRVTVYPPSRNLLARDGVVITVDSTFAGYRVDPLHDGITDTTGLEWSDAAWASAEVGSPHWVEAILPAPVRLHTVVLYWAEDQGRFWPSRSFRIEVEQAGRWLTVPGTLTDSADRSSTRIEFPAVETDHFRVWQEPGGGPADRPDLLWLSEVEIPEDAVSPASAR